MLKMIKQKALQLACMCTSEIWRHKNSPYIFPIPQISYLQLLLATIACTFPMSKVICTDCTIKPFLVAITRQKWINATCYIAIAIMWSSLSVVAQLTDIPCTIKIIVSIQLLVMRRLLRNWSMPSGSYIWSCDANWNRQSYCILIWTYSMTHGPVLISELLGDPQISYNAEILIAVW